MDYIDPYIIEVHPNNEGDLHRCEEFINSLPVETIIKVSADKVSYLLKTTSGLINWWTWWRELEWNFYEILIING